MRKKSCPYCRKRFHLKGLARHKKACSRGADPEPEPKPPTLYPKMVRITQQGLTIEVYS
jgi:hypothetical protein